MLSYAEQASNNNNLIKRMNDNSSNSNAEPTASSISSMLPPPIPIQPPPSVTPGIPIIEAPVRSSKRLNYFRNRMFICLLAIACNWGTTLRISKKIASSVIDVPPLDAVIMTCRYAYNITNDERQRYSQCVESRLNRCNRRMNNAVRNEDERVRELYQRNEEILMSMEEMSTSCSKSYTTFRLALQEWIAGGGEVPVLSSSGNGSGEQSTCSEEDQEIFNDTLLGPQNVLALQTEAIDVATTYSEESVDVVSNLAEYIVKRADYDVNYIDQKTEAIQNAFVKAMDYTPQPAVSIDDLLDELHLAAVDMLACISLEDLTGFQNGTKCSPNVNQLISDFYDDAVFKVEALKFVLRDYNDRMLRYKQNVERAYNVAKAFYDGVNNRVTKAVIGFFSGAWFDVTPTDFKAVDVPFPDVENIFSSIVGTFDSIDSMWMDVVPNVNDYFDKFSSISKELEARFYDMVDGIANDYNFTARLVSLSIPEDYDPPQYVGSMELYDSVEEEAKVFAEKSKAFRSKSRETLGLFSGIGGQYDEDELDMNVPTFNMTEIKNKVTNIELNFESFQQPDFDYDLWFKQLNFLSSGFELVDYIIRGYISARLLSKYWFATSLPMPQIDIRSYTKMKNPFRQNPVLATLSFLTSPIGGFMLFVASSSWLIGMVVALYVPLLRQYSSGCLRLGDGTFLTNNLYSFAYNHAYQDGSALLVEGMDMYDSKRMESCTARYTSSVNLQNNMNANLTAYTNFYQGLAQNMGLSRRCVDSEELDALFLDACCGLGSYPVCQSTSTQHTCPIDNRLDSPLPFDLPGTSLYDSSCSVEVDESDWILSDAIFDCESIPTCSVECEPPRKAFLAEASERCGCTVEWYIHSQWLGTALGFVIYLCMNIARVLFFAGLTRILWKHIHPNRFTVLTTCNSDGALVAPAYAKGESQHDLMLAIQTKSNAAFDDDEDETTSQHELSAALNEKLDHCIRSFYRVGTALLIASFAVNITWLTFVLLTSRSLTPRVWQ